MAALVLLLLACVLGAMWQRGTTVVEVRLDAGRAGVAQLFYGTSDAYSEGDSVRARVGAGANTLRFRVPDWGLAHLRFDPINNAGRVIVRDVRVKTSAGWRHVSDAAVQARANARLARAPDHAITVTSTSHPPDPQLSIKIPLSGRTAVASGRHGHYSGASLLLAQMALVLGLLMLAVLAARRLPLRVLVAAGLALAGGLILVLAVTVTSTRSVSPDEYSHVAAYDYYRSHLLPPAVDDPAVRPSISVWGYSYLMEWDVVYWLAGRTVAHLPDDLPGQLTAPRVFNVALWMVLLGIALLWPRRWKWACAVLLLSPQLWYVFGYFNGDAFPLVLALLAAGLVASGDGSVGEFLRDGRLRAGVVVLVLVLGLLLVSKRNYLVFLPVIFAWLAALHLRHKSWAVIGALAGFGVLGAALQLERVPSWDGWYLLAALGVLIIVASAAALVWANGQETPDRSRLLRLVALAVMALVVAAPRIAWDIAVNGGPSHKAAAMQRVAEATAGPGYRPSDIKAGTEPWNVRMAGKDISLPRLVVDHHWAQISARSLFGVYGYMDIVAGRWTYGALGAVFALMLLLAVRATILTSRSAGGPLVAIVLLGMAMVVMVSLMHSWVYSFAAQGRYLFAIFPMLALLLVHGQRRMPPVLTRTLLIVALAAGVWSMATVALPALTSL